MDKEQIMNELEEKKEEQLVQKTHSETFYHFKRLLCFFAVCFILFGMFTLVSNLYKRYRAKMPKSHVFVCDNPAHDSDFDTWLKETLEVTEVPEYIIIKNGSIIGKFPGAIPLETFSTDLALCAAYNLEIAKLPNYSITNLNGERKSLSNIFEGDLLYILEIHWIDCEDCQYQDENFTNDIYNKYSTSRFYRYYIKSETEKVEEKYT